MNINKKISYNINSATNSNKPKDSLLNMKINSSFYWAGFEDVLTWMIGKKTVIALNIEGNGKFYTAKGYNILSRGFEELFTIHWDFVEIWNKLLYHLNNNNVYYIIWSDLDKVWWELSKYFDNTKLKWNVGIYNIKNKQYLNILEKWLLFSEPYKLFVNRLKEEININSNNLYKSAFSTLSKKLFMTGKFTKEIIDKYVDKWRLEYKDCAKVSWYIGVDPQTSMALFSYILTWSWNISWVNMSDAWRYLIQMAIKASNTDIEKKIWHTYKVLSEIIFMNNNDFITLVDNNLIYFKKMQVIKNIMKEMPDSNVEEINRLKKDLSDLYKKMLDETNIEKANDLIFEIKYKTSILYALDKEKSAFVIPENINLWFSKSFLNSRYYKQKDIINKFENDIRKRIDDIKNIQEKHDFINSMNQYYRIKYDISCKTIKVLLLWLYTFGTEDIYLKYEETKEFIPIIAE